MGLFGMIRFFRMAYKMRKLVAAGVVLEAVLKRRMNSKKKSKKAFSSEEYFARAENLAAKAMSRFAQMRKQYARR